MPKTMKKRKKWKEKQRKKQTKLLFGVVCLIAIIFGGYAIWQYLAPSPSEEPPEIKHTSSLLTPYEFTMKDIDGTRFSLNSYRGNVVLIHLMGVGCHGQISSINDYQLKQLNSVCKSYCGNKPVTIMSVAVATCENSDLAQIRDNYDISWLFGNDVDDGTVDVAQNYAEYGDGTIVVIDKDFQISEAYSAIAASTLSSKINQLL